MVCMVTRSHSSMMRWISLLLLLLYTSDGVLGSKSLSKPIPRSNHRRSDSGALWNASPQIDEEGFLLSSFERIPGEWEENIITGKHRKSKLLADAPVRVRQVPGDGNCLFHALSVCLSKIQNGKHYIFGDIEDLRLCSRILRENAVDYLTIKPNRRLYLQGRDYVLARDLVLMAAGPYGCSGEEYCATMRKESYWGGGPEIVSLCNMLRRPIHVYELHAPNKKEFYLRRMACFGSPKFDRKEAIHILSADSRFPDIRPGNQLESGNHFLAIFPTSEPNVKRKRVRGGASTSLAKETKNRKERIMALASFKSLVSFCWNFIMGGAFF